MDYWKNTCHNLQKARVWLEKNWIRGDIRLFMPSVDYKIQEDRSQFLFTSTFSSCLPASSVYVGTQKLLSVEEKR